MKTVIKHKNVIFTVAGLAVDKAAVIVLDISCPGHQNMYIFIKTHIFQIVKTL